MTIIAVDIDDVTVELVSYLLKRYNKEYKDTVQEADIKSWEMHEYLKPECGKRIYEYFDPNRNPLLYSRVKLVDGVKEGISRLRKDGYEIVFATASYHEGKFSRLKREGLIESDKEFVIAKNKRYVNADYLIDDGMHNVEAFRGTGIIFTREWNKMYAGLRVDSWDDIIKMLSTSALWD